MAKNVTEGDGSDETKPICAGRPDETIPRTSVSPPARPLSQALDKMFKVGLVLKGLHGILDVAGILLEGILEVAGGILLLFF